MTQVIVYTNDNGNVSVCYPTGELPIEDVLAKDCPEHAIIVDADALPQGEDDFFDAWRLINGAVTVDLDAAKKIHLERFNAAAKAEAQHRQTNTAVGIENTPTDAEFLADLSAKRSAISAATSTAELRLIKVTIGV